MNRKALTALLENVVAGDHRVGMWDALQNELHPHVPEYARQAFLGSLDAAKALHEAVLPEWAWEVDRPNGAVVWYAHVEGDAPHHYGEDRNNHARAWLIAILKALISEAKA